MKTRTNAWSSRGFVLLAAILAQGSVAWAAAEGGKEGHGGVAVVCREPNPLPRKGKILKAQLLDLFEAREKGIRITPSAEEPLVQANSKAQRLLRHPMVRQKNREHVEAFARLLPSEISSVAVSIEFLRPGTGLPLIDDSFPRLYEKGCEFEQLARYNSDGSIDVDHEIWKELGKTDRAALYAHEAVYKIARERRKATDSVSSREAVGAIFADQMDLKAVSGPVWLVYDKKAASTSVLCYVSYDDGREATWPVQANADAYVGTSGVSVSVTMANPAADALQDVKLPQIYIWDSRGRHFVGDSHLWVRGIGWGISSINCIAQ